MNHISLHQTAVDIRDSNNSLQKGEIIHDFLDFHSFSKEISELSNGDKRVIELMNTILHGVEIVNIKESLIELKELNNAFQDTINQVDRILSNDHFATAA